MNVESVGLAITTRETMHTRTQHVYYVGLVRTQVVVIVEDTTIFGWALR